MIKKASFGNLKIFNETATYDASSWVEISESYDIAMYTTIPGTMKAVDLPSITLQIIGWGKIKEEECPSCNLPMKEHEMDKEFIDKIKRREKNKPIRIDNIDNLLVNH